jgi:hypothetical protein
MTAASTSTDSTGADQLAELLAGLTASVQEHTDPDRARATDGVRRRRQEARDAVGPAPTTTPDGHRAAIRYGLTPRALAYLEVADVVDGVNAAVAAHRRQLAERATR